MKKYFLVALFAAMPVMAQECPDMRACGPKHPACFGKMHRPHGPRPQLSEEQKAEMKAKFQGAMEDDLNAPKALAIVWETVRGAELNAAEKVEFLKFADGVLSLDLFRVEETKAEALPAEVEELLQARAAARAAKDYKKSDELRMALREAGYAVKDTPQGQQVEKI